MPIHTQDHKRQRTEEKMLNTFRLKRYQAEVSESKIVKWISIFTHLKRTIRNYSDKKM